MANLLCRKRLSKEYLNLQKKPIDLIRALPREDNILEWHYLIEGPKDSPYAGGFYHGVLKFPADYPYKPPSILMYTPNGRFIPNQRLCLSMSDFHPESWNPMWSVSSILAGLLSFMLDTSKTYGSMESTTPQKQQYSAQSLDFNVRNNLFRQLFPEMVAVQEERKRLRQANGEGADVGASAPEPTTSGESEACTPWMVLAMAIPAILIAVYIALPFVPR